MNHDLIHEGIYCLILALLILWFLMDRFQIYFRDNEHD